MRFWKIAIPALLLAVCGRAAAADPDYPTREISLIVPYAAGGPTDIVARIIADSMAEALGQPINIENVVGGGGTTAATRVMRATADGYTIMMGNSGTHGAAMALYSTLPYNPRRDFAPIGMVTGIPELLLVRRDLPTASFKDFAAYARKQDGTIRMAHAGIGSISYTTGMLLNKLLGLRPVMVAYQGTGPAMNALLAGQVDYLCDQIVNDVPQVRAGTILALAITTAQRSPVLSKVPTAAEVGLPGFQVSAWNALFAPRDTPKPVIDKLNRALSAALDDPATHRRLAELGGTPPEGQQRGPTALADLVDTEISKWMALVKPGEQANR